MGSWLVGLLPHHFIDPPPHVAWIFADVFGLLSFCTEEESLGRLGVVAGFGTARSCL